jgi:broad specificity phosphatase PhoE
MVTTIDRSRDILMTSSNTTRLSFIRHGHVHNPDEVIYGRLPGFRLSREGREQVTHTSDHLKTAELAALYASPQLRARQTAEIIRQAHPNLEIIIEPLINEVDCYFEGHPASEVEARGWDLYTGVEEGYETPIDVAARAWTFIQQVRRIHQGSHTAAVSHGDVIAFAILCVMQEPLKIERKRTLHRFGIIDSYPVTASITTMTYKTERLDEIPEIAYVKPYDSSLIVDSLS